jgi:hypothetical protein
MERDFQSPGGMFINETGQRDYQPPSGEFINETAPALPIKPVIVLQAVKRAATF